MSKAITAEETRFYPTWQPWLAGTIFVEPNETDASAHRLMYVKSLSATPDRLTRMLARKHTDVSSGSTVEEVADILTGPSPVMTVVNWVENWSANMGAAALLRSWARQDHGDDQEQAAVLEYLQHSLDENRRHQRKLFQSE